MKPKQITRSTFLMGVGGAAALAAFGARAMAQATRPNVLWIFDDDHPPYMMEPMPVTRNGIRDVGIDFVRGHADVPLCGPNRVSVLTGLSVTTHGCDTNQTWSQFIASPRDLQDRTVARYMKDALYATGHFGKYINGHGALTGDVPPHWDRWAEVGGGGADEAGETNYANLDGEVVELPRYVRPSEWAARRTAEFVRGRAGLGPWFAQFCPTDPHSPYTPTRENRHHADGDTRRVPSTNEREMADKPGWMKDLDPVGETKIQATIEGKKEELADLDSYGIRPIIEALAETGQLANTLILFGSDNGYLAGEHRLEKKDHPYWESAEVPFFAKGAGTAVGLRSSALVSTADWMPTTCEAAGISPALLDVDGRSMLGGLSTGDFSSWRRRMLVTGSDDVGPEQNPGGSDDPSGRWWLLAEDTKRFILRENGAKELYWMGADPFQKRSRHDDADPALIRRLTDTVEAMRRASGDERRALEATPA